jgi:hypothetical protein
MANITRKVVGSVKIFDGKKHGIIRISFASPETHWIDEVAYINVDFRGNDNPVISFNYGSGGTGVRNESGKIVSVSDIAIAQAMSTVFKYVEWELIRLNTSLGVQELLDSVPHYVENNGDLECINPEVLEA